MAEEILQLLDVININDTLYSGALETCLKDEEIYSGKLVATLNKRLGSSVTRNKSFELLYKLLEDLPVADLEENCVLWTNHAVNTNINETVPGRRLQFLAKLIKLCHGNQDYYKHIVTNALTNVIDSCVAINIKSAEAEYSLECITNCLIHFPSTCIVHKKKIEEYVLRFIDTPVQNAVLERAAKCFHYLNQVGASGPSGITHTKNYKDSFEKLFHSLNFTYDELFENINEFDDLGLDNSLSLFHKVPCDLKKSDAYRIMARRLRNVTTFLIKTLECSYPAKKSFNPELINVIQRGLAVHVHKDANDFDKHLLSVVIQEHQMDLIVLLKAIICCLKQNFIRFSTITLLLDYLARTKNCTCFNTNSKFQINVYKVLKYWMLNSGESIVSGVYDKIMNIIISDITPTKKSLVLNLNIEKSKKKLIQNKTGIVTSTEGSRKIKQEVCYYALRTLKLLLEKIPLNIKSTTCNILFDTITKTLMNIILKNYLEPYTNKKCQLELFKVLIAIFDQNVISLDFGIAISILNLGEQCCDSEISYVCSRGLAALEKICQPIHVSLALQPYTTEATSVRTDASREIQIIVSDEDEPISRKDDCVDVEMEDLQLELSPDVAEDAEQSEEIVDLDEDSIQYVKSSGDEKRKNEDEDFDEAIVPSKIFKLDEMYKQTQENEADEVSEGNEVEEIAVVNEIIEPISIVPNAEENKVVVDDREDLEEVLATFVDEVNDY